MIGAANIPASHHNAAFRRTVPDAFSSQGITDSAHSVQIIVTDRQRSLSGRIHSAGKRNATLIQDLRHFQYKILIGREILLILNGSVFRIAENVFLRRNIRYGRLLRRNIRNTCNLCKPHRISYIERDINGIITGISVIVYTGVFKLFLQFQKIRSTDGHNIFLSVICCLVPDLIAVSFHLCLPNLLFQFRFWYSAQHIVPVFVQIGRNNTLHLRIICSQPVCKFIAGCIVI